MNVKPKNQKEVNHKTLSSSLNLDRLPHDKLEKKYRPCLPVDEIIFRTTKILNRLILELMAGGGMPIGEVLKLRLFDIQGRKLIIKEPKSGKEQEVVYIPQKVADRLRE